METTPDVGLHIQQPAYTKHVLGGTMHLLDDGQPLRDLMAEAGLTIPALAAETRTIDGYGISPSAIGHLVSTGASRRRRCSLRTADLITRALARKLGRPVRAFDDTA